MDDRQALRPEVVAQLSQPAHLPASVVDAALDATDEERAAAARALLEDARAFLEAAGVLPSSVGVLSLPYRTMAALASAFMTVHRTWELPGHVGKPLSDVLKVVDAREAQWVVRVLAWGGLLPPEPASP